MPISHLGITVPDINTARNFYLATLAPIGYKLRVSHRDGKELGFGVTQAPDFWLAEQEYSMQQGGSLGGEYIHLAFKASNREQVRQFYQAAIAAGGKDNGKPGLRPHYFKWFYGAFVYDLEGRNLEAVCLKPAFLAEPWGIIEWSIVIGSILSLAVGGGVKWFGWI